MCKAFTVAALLAFTVAVVLSFGCAGTYRCAGLHVPLVTVGPCLPGSWFKDDKKCENPGSFDITNHE